MKQTDSEISKTEGSASSHTVTKDTAMKSRPLKTKQFHEGHDPTMESLYLETIWLQQPGVMDKWDGCSHCIFF